MSLFDQYLPDKLQKSRDKQEIITFLSTLGSMAELFPLAKQIYMEWAKYHQIEVTGEDIEKLKGSS